MNNYPLPPAHIYFPLLSSASNHFSIWRVVSEHIALTSKSGTRHSVAAGIRAPSFTHPLPQYDLLIIRQASNTSLLCLPGDTCSTLVSQPRYTDRPSFYLPASTTSHGIRPCIQMRSINLKHLPDWKRNLPTLSQQFHATRICALWHHFLIHHYQQWRHLHLRQVTCVPAFLTHSVHVIRNTTVPPSHSHSPSHVSNKSI